MQWQRCFIVLILLFTRSWATKNVLVLDGVASPSHQVWMHSLSRSMAAHGYNVTSLSCKLIKSESPNLHGYLLDNMYPEEEDTNFLEMTSMSPLEKMKFFLEFTSVYEEIVPQSSGFKAIMNFPKDFKFDLIVFDYIGVHSLLAFADRYPTARLIGASAYPAIEFTNLVTKAPGLPSFIPNMYMDDVEQTFCSRLGSFLLYVLNHLVAEWNWFTRSDKALRPYYQTKRPLKEIYESMEIQLTNHQPVLDFVTPIMPGVIPVGGLQIETPKPLPKDLEEVFATAKKGVIHFALGSNVKSEMLGERRLKAIIGALAELPDYNIIWKIDISKLDLQLPKNVFIKSWLPQNDILADKRTKLFISHAGGLSTQEATWYGQPMLALPVMFDQFPNAAKAVKSGMALQLDIRNIDKETMKATILELLNNQKYREAAQLRSRNFQDQKESPRERALWWMDYVLRNPDISFLKSAKLENMNYVTKHSIDVIAFLTIIIGAAVLGIVKLICLIHFKSKKNERIKKKIN